MRYLRSYQFNGERVISRHSIFSEAIILRTIETGWLVEKGETISNLSVAVPSFSSKILIY